MYLTGSSASILEHPGSHHSPPDVEGTLCGSLTFQEQRNTIENLCQKPQEAAIDFLIRVGTSVSNLGKDWKTS